MKLALLLVLAFAFMVDAQPQFRPRPPYRFNNNPPRRMDQQPPPPPPRECDENGNCDADHTCADDTGPDGVTRRVCLRSCSEQSPCHRREDSCTDGVCRGPRPQEGQGQGQGNGQGHGPRQGPDPCGENRSCPSGDTCVDETLPDGAVRSVCLKACSDQSQCHQGHSCEDGACKGPRPQEGQGQGQGHGNGHGQGHRQGPPPCGENRSCPSGDTCVDETLPDDTVLSVCLKACSDPSECHRGDSCEDGACRGPRRDGQEQQPGNPPQRQREGPPAQQGQPRHPGQPRRGPPPHHRRGPPKPPGPHPCGPEDTCRNPQDKCVEETGRHGEIRKVCLKNCTQDSDCRDGIPCDAEVGACRAQHCNVSDSDCPTGTTCAGKPEGDEERDMERERRGPEERRHDEDRGMCLLSCTPDGDECNEGSECIDNVCRREHRRPEFGFQRENELDFLRFGPQFMGPMQGRRGPPPPRPPPRCRNGTCPRAGDVCVNETGRHGEVHSVCLKGCSNSTECRDGIPCDTDVGACRVRHCNVSDDDCPTGTKCAGKHEEGEGDRRGPGMGGPGGEQRGPGMGGPGGEQRGPGMGGPGGEHRGPGMDGPEGQHRGPGMGGPGGEQRGPGMGGPGGEHRGPGMDGPEGQHRRRDEGICLLECTGDAQCNRGSKCREGVCRREHRRPGPPQPRPCPAFCGNGMDCPRGTTCEALTLSNGVDQVDVCLPTCGEEGEDEGRPCPPGSACSDDGVCVKDTAEPAAP